jgi:uncharacterized protein (TIGR03083 family)
MIPTHDPHVASCLAAIRERSTAIALIVEPLSLDQWGGPTNCPPWLVSDLATHLVTSGQGFVRSIRQGLEGNVEPSPGSSHMAADGPHAVAAALTALTDEFESLYAGLSDARLDMICYHRRGNRSVRWYAAHRLAEVSFHGWDLDVSLGRQASLSPEVASLLLPTLLESNVPRTYAAGLSTERGTGERYLLVASGDDPSARWLVTINPDALQVSREGGAADLTISAPAATLALLVYGRAELQSCGATLEGDSQEVERFAKIFPRP